MALKPFTIFIGLRYAGARRQRKQLVSFISGLSILGLTLGVGLLLIVLSVMNGFDRELQQRILGILPHGSVYQRNGVEDWQALRQQLLADSEVVAAAPFVEVQSMLSVGKRVKPAILYGIDAETENSVSVIERFVDGDLLHKLRGDSEQPVILLGRGLAEVLKVQPGDRITVLAPDSRDGSKLPHFRALQLIGIINTGTELDYALALTSLQTASELSEFPGKVSGVRIRTTDLFSAPDTIYRLVRPMPYGFYGTDWTRSHGNLYHAVHMSKNLVGLLLFLIVAIAAFNVVSTLVMVVVDKQGDIAILKTLGAGRREIMAVFMVQGMVIGAVGTLAGLVLGVVGSLTVQQLVGWLEQLLGIQFLNAEIYPVDYLPSAMQLQDFILVAVVSMGMSLVATLYPAWRASRVAPAEVLRYE